jgi:chromosome transmission fidelity protein 4
VTRAELEIDKNLLKALQTACKAEKLQQALDVVNLLTHPQSIDAAAKLAGFFHLTGLQERIHAVKEAKLYQHKRDEKRRSKWGHLADDRTIVGSGLQPASRNGGGSGGSLFSTPFEDTIVPRSSLVTNRQSLSVQPPAAASEERRRESLGTPSRSFAQADESWQSTETREEESISEPQNALSTPFDERGPPPNRRA